MDPNTLNLKNQQTSPTGNIPTVQSGTVVHLSGEPMSTGSTNTSTGALPPLSSDEQAILDETQKELRTRYELLPSEIQETIISSDYQMKLFELAKKYKITYADLGQLELETTMVLLGMTPPEELEESLAAAINKDRKTTIAPLVKEIDTQIFSPIRTQLVELYAEKKESVAPTTATPAVPLAQELASKPPVSLAVDDEAVGGISFAKTTTAPVSIEPATTPSMSTPVAPALEKHEDEMLKNSGIEIGATAPAAPKDPFMSKLNSVFGVKSATTDHTLPKMGESGVQTQASTNPAKGVDPYREIV